MSEAAGFGTISDNDTTVLQEALAGALERSDDVSLHPMAGDVRTAEPRRDRGGTLYIGQWRLDPIKKRFILRPLQAREGAVFEADVTRTEDGWTVGDVTVGRQVAPRR